MFCDMNNKSRVDVTTISRESENRIYVDKSHNAKIVHLESVLLSWQLTYIAHRALREGFVSSLPESAIICPLLKKRLPQSIENDLRPISLTCHITKIIEGFQASHRT